MTTDPVLGRLGGFPRLILFDLDDTLFDHSFACRSGLAAMREAHRLFRSVPLDELCVVYGRLLRETFADVAIGRLDHDTSRERRFRRLAEYAGSSISAAQAREYSNEYRARYDVARRMVPGILPLLDALGPRARLGVVTNNTWEEQAGKLRLLGVFDRFVGLTASDVVGVPKPDPGIFVAALDQAGVGPEETVMVGDSWAEDVRGAIAAGIPPVWFNRFRSPPLDPVAVPTVISVVPVTATVAAIRDAHARRPREALGPRR